MNIFEKLYCAIFGCEPEITADPSDRLDAWHGYLNEASARLDMDLKSDARAVFVPAERMIGGKAAIEASRRNDLDWVGGETIGNRKDGFTARLAMYPGGRLGEWTGLHEAAHVILFSNGIAGDKHHEIMRNRGIPTQ